ncbi:MAG TPA: Asd/ArgC dimerization domain-containing protein [Candidatus Binatia bacterium]
MSDAVRIAIVGATTEVASELIDVLAARGFDLTGLRVLADESLAGEAIEAAGWDVRVEPAVAGSLGGVDVALFLGDGELARALVPEAREQGAIVIDASPFSRDELGAPLVLPEVNAASVKELAKERVLAIPGPHTAGLAAALAPLHEAATVRRVVTTVFESASLRGREAMDELSRQSVTLMQGRGIDRRESPEQLAFNARPQPSSLEGEGWSVDERRLAREITTLFDAPIDVAATVVRIPVFAGTAQAVFVELANELTLDEATKLLREGRGVVLPEPPIGSGDGAETLPDEDDDSAEPDEDEEELDGDEPDLLHDQTPGPVDVNGSEAVHVARLRTLPRDPRALAFWLAFDDLRKGLGLTLVATLEIALRELR